MNYKIFTYKNNLLLYSNDGGLKIYHFLINGQVLNYGVVDDILKLELESNGIITTKDFNLSTTNEIKISETKSLKNIIKHELDLDYDQSNELIFYKYYAYTISIGANDFEILYSIDDYEIKYVANYIYTANNYLVVHDFKEDNVLILDGELNTLLKADSIINFYNDGFNHSNYKYNINDKIGFIFPSHNIISGSFYDDILNFYEINNNTYVLVKINNKFGVVDLNCNIVIDVVYDEIKNITNNKSTELFLCRVDKNKFIIGLNNILVHNILECDDVKINEGLNLDCELHCINYINI